uniref:Uncharacterized protein n=1 Tax=Opuntia streptacantha TaxID=393608 RepID=A0A7C8ZNG6_OPUST
MHFRWRNLRSYIPSIQPRFLLTAGLQRAIPYVHSSIFESILPSLIQHPANQTRAISVCSSLDLWFNFARSKFNIPPTRNKLLMTIQLKRHSEVLLMIEGSFGEGEG